VQGGSCLPQKRGLGSAALVTCVIPARRRARCRDGRALGRFGRVAACCSRSACCPRLLVLLVRLWVPEIAALGFAARAATRRAAQGRWPGRCRWSLPRCRYRPPPMAGPIIRIELARPVSNIPRSPDCVLARQCRWHRPASMASRSGRPSLFVASAQGDARRKPPRLMILPQRCSASSARLSFSFFSELMGRRNAGGLLGFGAGCPDHRWHGPALRRHAVWRIGFFG